MKRARRQDMTGRPLTLRQREVLRTLHRLTRQRGVPPTVRELGEAIGCLSTNATSDHLCALERRGLVVRGQQAARVLLLTARGRAELCLPQKQKAPPAATGEASEVNPDVPEGVCAMPSMPTPSDASEVGS
jgi:SOS-response transcriptional repressor LexA